ncbi:hypothetical protein [Streptomyces sp. NPDC017890]|uniref:hypothetical protein n=1 Tax=Streptomyces sp. NPDC017890 TaxID=3365015 RepID=UPI00378A15BB
MLGEVVADHGEVGDVSDVVVDDARTGLVVAKDGLGARGHAKVLGTHQEALLFLGGQALVGDATH